MILLPIGTEKLLFQAAEGKKKRSTRSSGLEG